MARDRGTKEKRVGSDPPALTGGALEITLLRGSLEILDNGQPMEVPTEPLQRAALVVLALKAGQEVNVDTIARACYSDFETLLEVDPGLLRNARKRVSETLSVLRTSFRLPVTTRPYKLAIEPENVDLLRFDRRAKELLSEGGKTSSSSVPQSRSEGARGRPALLPEIEATLALWTEDPALTFNECIHSDVLERFARRHHDLAILQVEVLVEIGALRRALDLITEHESSYPGDGQLAALRRRSERGLEEELSKPGDLSDRPRHNLPPPPAQALVGRDEEFGEAIRVLRPHPHSRYHIVTIDGVGGVGKTALALAVAYHYVPGAGVVDRVAPPPAGELFDAVVWTSAKATQLEVSGITGLHQMLRTLADIYSAIAITLGRREILAVPENEQHALIHTALSELRVLLVIDNLETVDDERVLDFLRELPVPSKAIVTTRHHRIDGGRTLRLEGLPPDIAVELVKAEESRLTLERSRIRVALTEAEQWDLAKTTAGIPLAIIWTLGQLGVGGELQHVMRRLRSAKGEYAQFCFDGSIQSLRSQNQHAAVQLLLSLALFADGATRDALGFVCGLHDRPYERDPALNLLIDMSLVNFEENRFSLLPLTREFALGELAGDLTIKEPATGRWLDWCLQITDRAGKGGTDLDPTVLSTLEVEHQNILFALEFAFRYERLDVFVKLLRSMEFFWLGTGRWREFDDHLGKGRVVAPAPQDKIHFGARLIWLKVLHGDLEEAERLLGEVRSLIARFPDDYELMRVEDFEGQLRLEQGRFEQAEGHLLESLKIARRLKDRRGCFACNVYLGELYCLMDRSDLARERLAEAETFVGVPGENQWLRGRAFTARLRALILQAEENWDGAVSAFTESINYLDFHLDTRLLTKARHGLALVQERMGRLDEAQRLLRANARTFQGLGMWSHAAEAEALLAKLEGEAP